MRVLFTRIVCFMAIILYTSVGATGIVVRGRVIDAVTNEPLPGANILLKHSYIGTAAGNNGIFSIDIPDGAGFALIVTMMGYKRHTISFSGVNDTITDFIEIRLLTFPAIIILFV